MTSAGSQLFIAGDWGTSRLRLYLCDGDEVIERQAGPGAVGVATSHEQILFELTAPWRVAHGALPVLLCGMVGSRNGWIEAPYAPCPADAGALRAQLVRLDSHGAPVGIVPGVKAISPRGAPDVMRGEETQIIGALALLPDLARGRHLLALPGTHTKWARVEDGRITTFQTAFAGELFALLRDHGTLTNLAGADAAANTGGFDEGLTRHAEAGSAGLLHELFETRGRQLLDGWAGAYALDFLSGLLIANDVGGALVQFETGGQPVTLIGDPVLTDRYGRALARHDVTTQIIGGEASALAGLRALFQTQSESVHP
jgi:2-dehydro-3-deoxygalactonokinase